MRKLGEKLALIADTWYGDHKGISTKMKNLFLNCASMGNYGLRVYKKEAKNSYMVAGEGKPVPHIIDGHLFEWLEDEANIRTLKKMKINVAFRDNTFFDIDWI